MKIFYTLLISVISFSQLYCQSVVVNEYFNQTGSLNTNEAVELLVLEDNVNLKRFQLTDFVGRIINSTLTFSNNNLWQNLPMGTLIVIGGSNSVPDEDIDPSDKIIKIRIPELNQSNNYFSEYCGLTNFYINSLKGGVEILDKYGYHIHGLSHGINNDIFPSPRGWLDSASCLNYSVGFIGTTDFSDFNTPLENFNVASGLNKNASTSLISVSLVPTLGEPNDEAQNSFFNTVLPVELSSFIAKIIQNNVELSWTTNSEINNHYFSVERKLVNSGNWITIGSLNGKGTTNSASTYKYDDKNLTTGIYVYKIKQIDLNGNYHYYNLANEISITKPDNFILEQNYPDPFNPTTKISYAIPENGTVKLQIFDNLGREVRTMINTFQKAGYYEAEFNAGNLASGIYYYKLEFKSEFNSYEETLKMVLIK